VIRARVHILILPLLALAGGCDRLLDPRESGGVALANNVARAGAVEVCVAGDALAAPAERAARRLGGAALEVSVRSTAGGGDARAARVVIGTFDDGAVGALLARLGVAVEGGALELLGRELRAGDVLLSACFEDPLRARLPVTLLASGDERRLADALPRLRVGSRPELTLEVRGARALRVKLALDGTPLADTLEEWTSRVLAQPGEYRADGDAAVEGWGVRAAREVDAERLSAYVSRVQGARARLGAWLDVPEPGGLVLVGESHVDGFAHGGAVDRWARHDRASGLLHALLAAGAPDDGGAAAAAGWATDALGAPALPWLADAAGIDAADAYWSVPLEEWCGRLARAQAPSFEQLVAGDDGGRSPHELRPLRALLVRVVREQPEGAALLRRVWRGAAALDEVESRYAARLAAAVASAPARAARRVTYPFRGAVVTPAPAAGAAFGTRACARALGDLGRYGADAAGFTVSFVSAPGPGDGRPLGATYTASVEGDVAVAAAIAAARASGLTTTLLLPTLLAAPSAGPAGDVVRVTAAQWDQLFEANARCARHCALLAELCGVDILALGEGMPEAARTVWTLDEDENEVQAVARERKTAGWAAAVAAARASFDGALTFAAAEPRKVVWSGFMDELDAVGLRFLRNLEQRDEPGPPSDDAARRRLAHDLGECAAAAGGKPWIVLPAGFRSTRRAWRGPHAGDGGATSGAEQARLLRALAGALREVPPDGLLLWRWSSDPHAGGAGDRDYVLQNKPALDVLPGLFDG
jgi:hypothetical protein